METVQGVVTGVVAELLLDTTRELLHLRDAVVALVVCVNLWTGVNLKAFKHMIQPNRLTQTSQKRKTSPRSHPLALFLEAAEAIMALKEI